MASPALIIAMERMAWSLLREVRFSPRKYGMNDTAWFLVIGVLLTFMAFAGSVLKRAPLSAAMFYLAAGYVIGPAALGLLDLRLPAGVLAVDRVAEVAVLVSLFTAGLKLRIPPGDRRWLLPISLAIVSMAITVELIAVIGMSLLCLRLARTTDRLTLLAWD